MDIPLTAVSVLEGFEIGDGGLISEPGVFPELIDECLFNAGCHVGGSTEMGFGPKPMFFRERDPRRNFWDGNGHWRNRGGHFRLCGSLPNTCLIGDLRAKNAGFGHLSIKGGVSERRFRQESPLRLCRAHR